MKIDISLSIAQLKNVCRDYGVEPNRVRLSPRAYQQFCKEKAATFVARGMHFAISTIYTDAILVDRWSKRWGASRIHASQTTWRMPNANQLPIAGGE